MSDLSDLLTEHTQLINRALSLAGKPHKGDVLRVLRMVRIKKALAEQKLMAEHGFTEDDCVQASIRAIDRYSFEHPKYFEKIGNSASQYKREESYDLAQREYKAMIGRREEKVYLDDLKKQIKILKRRQNASEYRLQVDFLKKNYSVFGGEMTARQCAKMLGISEATLYERVRDIKHYMRS